MKTIPQKKCRYCAEYRQAYLINSHRQQCWQRQREKDHQSRIAQLKEKIETCPADMRSFWQELLETVS